MLTIYKEFRKGILFVRLLGVLNKETVNCLNEEVTTLIEDMKIMNVVFNIKQLEEIDMYGVNEILLSYQICKKNNGVSYLCGVNDNIKETINKSLISCMYEVSDEISAINLIKI